MRYRIITKEFVTTWYEIDASSKDDAINAAASGEEEPIDKTYIEIERPKVRVIK